MFVPVFLIVCAKPQLNNNMIIFVWFIQCVTVTKNQGPCPWYVSWWRWTSMSTYEVRHRELLLWMTLNLYHNCNYSTSKTISNSVILCIANLSHLQGGNNLCQKVKSDTTCINFASHSITCIGKNEIWMGACPWNNSFFLFTFLTGGLRVIVLLPLKVNRFTLLLPSYSNGIFHRDVKPENILIKVSKNDAENLAC